MPFILMVTFVFIVISISCLTWLGINHIFAQQISIRMRLKDMVVLTSTQGQVGIEDELEISFRERVLAPIMQKLSQITQKYTPVRKKEFIEKKLDYAGRPYGWNSGTYLFIQYFSAVLVAILCLVISIISGVNWGLSLVIALAGLLGGYVLVDLYLNTSITKHQKGIEKEMPDVLDLLTISIEAGLGFDAAMQRVVQKARGPMGEEINQTIQEMRMGKTRREALRDLALRNGVDDLTKFVEAITQADQLGVSLGNVLRNQSDQIRVLRRQRVEERAMKAPVKMLIPILIFIFPCVFVIIMAPAIMQVLEVI